MNSKYSPLKFLFLALFVLQVAKAEAAEPVTAPVTAPAEPSKDPATQQTPENGAKVDTTPKTDAGTQPIDKNQLVASEGTDQPECQRKLLVSLGLEGLRKPKEMTLEMCSKVKNSCCRHSDQLTIFDNWIKGTEHESLNDLLLDHASVYDRVVDLSGQVYERAKTIFDLVKDRKKSNCKILSKRIMAFDIVALGPKIKDATKIMHDFFKESHKGFYCAVCDADNQKFIDVRGHKFVYNEEFCRGITKNSLNFLLYYHIYFNKYLNLHIRFLNSCNNKGKYEDKTIRNAPSFVAHSVVYNKLMACRKYRNEEHWIDHCGDICNAFQVTKYNDFFAPNLKKFDRFNRFTARKLLKFKKQAEMEAIEAAKASATTDGKNNGDAAPKAGAATDTPAPKRRLADAPANPTPAPAQGGAANPKANADAGATAPPAPGAPGAPAKPVVPVLTAEELETQLTEIFDFEANPPVIRSAMGTDMDVENFVSKYQEAGINLYKYGTETNISDGALKNINHEEEVDDEIIAAKAIVKATAAGLDKSDNIVRLWGGLIICLVTLLIK